MKTKIMIIISCTLLLFAAGCKKNKDKEPETFFSDIARPTWTTPDNYDITSSMTAVVKVDLKAQYPETAADFVPDANDLLAAFSGETCLGVAQPQDGFFYLYVASPTTDSDNSLTGEAGLISLRYYSARYKNLFDAKDAFLFANDAHLGTVAEPFIPKVVATK